MSRDWHAWHRHYDDPTSSLSQRLVVVREQLGQVLTQVTSRPRLVSMCAGDGRDTLPVLAAYDEPVAALLVELDPELAETARTDAARLGLADVEVRTADAGTTTSYAGQAPAEVVMACGVFGNITDADLARTVAALPSFLVEGGYVVWTRGSNVPLDPTSVTGDPADLVRDLLATAGFEEVAFVRDASGFRVGTHRWPGPSGELEPGRRLFDFV